MATKKFSDFFNGNAPISGDQFVGLRGSTNTRFAMPFPLTPALGGSGLSSPTAHSIPIAQGVSAFSLITLITGQLLGGVTSADPAPYTLVAGTNMTSILFNDTAKTITFNAASGSGSEVTFQNNFYIADNGSDTTGIGDGSLSKPYLTGTKTQAVIVAASPSATNTFYVHDQRTAAVSENLKWLPFVKWEAEGKTDFSGNLSLDSLFGSIATDSWSWWGGYRNYDSAKTMTYDVSGLSTANAIHLTLANAEKCPCTYSIIGNDFANFNSDIFRINEINFNTSGQNVDGSFWQANCSMASGVTRRIRYCQGWQISSITKSLGSALATTMLDVAFCNTVAFQPSIGTLALISSGGANNQPEIEVNISACDINGTVLTLDITNDGASNVNFDLDISVNPVINSANSLVNISFNNFMRGDYLQSQYSPVNFSPASWTDSGGIFVSGGTYGSMLKGIDNKLGPDIKGFQLTWNNVGPPATITIGPGSGLDSTKLFIMSLTSPVTLDTTSASIDNGASWTPDEWYAVWLYQNSTTLATTMKLSLSFSSPATIVGYDMVKYVRSIKAQTTGTNILSVIQRGKNNEIIYYWNDTDPALNVLPSGNALIGAPGTFSCAGAQSPISNEINLQYNFTPGLARAGDDFAISNADDPTEELVIFSGLVASLTANGLTGFLPTNSSQNLSYFVDNTLDNLSLIAVGYKESL